MTSRPEYLHVMKPGRDWLILFFFRSENHRGTRWQTLQLSRERYCKCGIEALAVLGTSQP